MGAILEVDYDDDGGGGGNDDDDDDDHKTAHYTLPNDVYCYVTRM